MTLLGWEQPPVDMPMPETLERGITYGFMVAAAVLFVVGAVAWQRTKSPTYFLILFGALFCTPNEAMLNVPAKIWHAESENFHLYTSFGRPMGLWVPFAYVVFFGALPCLLVILYRRGIGYGRLWAGIAGFVALNAVVELPLTGDGGMYTYYGYQPFALGDWSTAQLATNGVGIVLIATLVFKARHLFRGIRALLLIPLVPIGQAAGLAVGAPAFWVMNADIARVWQWAGVGATLSIGLLVIDSLLRVGTGRQQLAVSPTAETSQPASRPVAPAPAPTPVPVR